MTNTLGSMLCWIKMSGWILLRLIWSCIIFVPYLYRRYLNLFVHNITVYTDYQMPDTIDRYTDAYIGLTLQ